MTSKAAQLLENWRSKSLIDKAIFLAAVALVVLVFSFAGYYYWDRYVNIGDQSPVEMSLDAIENAVRENPQDPDLRLNLALTYLEAGQYTQAREQAYQVIDFYPDRNEAYFIIGLASYELHDYATAVINLNQFAEIRRESPAAMMDDFLQTALYYLGDSYLELDLPNEAVEALEEALLINSMDADAFYKLGAAFAGAGNHEKAVENYMRATDFVPNFLEAYQGLIESYSALNDPGMVSYSRGMEALTLEDYSTAEIHLLAAAAEYPNNPLPYIGLAMLYEQTADYESALTYIETAVELDPHNFLANNILGRLNFLMGEGSAEQ